MDGIAGKVHIPDPGEPADFQYILFGCSDSFSVHSNNPGYGTSSYFR